MVGEPEYTFLVPEDPEFLQAVARVTICHAHLDYALRMCIRSLAGVTIEEARDATVYDGARMLRDRVRRLARMRLGDGQPLVKLQALLKRAGDLSEQRNSLTHHIIVRKQIGNISSAFPAERLLPDHSWEALPSAVEVNKLAEALTALVKELNHAR
ncbi:MAG TPA: hypothetical protein VEJ86_11355, partial [Candidatus Binataceae bacterium]|nr:hypothetical protein [Candidatus Binataceae bacterium]